MLILSRKTGQRIILSGGITITLVETARGKARIGIDAPEGVSINREELVWRGEEFPRKEGGKEEAKNA